MKLLSSAAFLLITLLTVRCSEKKTENQTADSTQTSTAQPSDTAMTVQRETFGKLPDGREAYLFTLTNNNGMTVKITNYGAIVTSVITPDQSGNPGDVVLGFDSLAPYLKEHPYFGAVVGRYGNRIANGKFTLNGKQYTLATNNNQNHLHGGKVGFDKKLWDAQPTQTAEGQALKLTYRSPDGEEGYPGNLTSTVTYTLTDNNELRMQYEAQTDMPTPVNLTNHSYFNLSAGKASTVLNHEIMLNADRYVPVNASLIPTGKLLPVKGTPMDFTQPQPIGKNLKQTGGDPIGYDHTFVLNKPASADSLTLAARVYEPVSGRQMEVYTTQPGVQFYTGNFLNGSLAGKNNQNYGQYAGFCLETQHFPDSPNQSSFPSTILQPSDKYQQTTVYQFSARKAQ